MSRSLAAVLGAWFLLFTGTAHAHRIDEYLQATLLSLDAHRVQASMRLIPAILVSSSVIAAIDTNADGIFSQAEQQVYAQRVLADLSLTLDGTTIKPSLISWSFPQPAALHDGLGEIHIDFAANLPPGGARRSFVLTNHHLGPASVYLVNVTVPEDRDLHILAQKRNELQTVYELDYQQAQHGAGPSTWASSTVWLDRAQFSSLFHLGMRHIAEGTDHLLFLLTLLLPAPLLVANHRWGPAAGVRASLLRILGIVTAFTLGHSFTLALAAFGAVHLPARPIEVLIAVSIFISAVHALRPILPGKEALVAGFFGLIHGLAFAATLGRLGLGPWQRALGVLAFNLGIETMQILVVAAVLPSLLLMSRTRAYPVLRIGGALVAAVAATGWFIERISGLDTPVDSIVNACARHAGWIALTLFLTSLTCALLPKVRSRKPVHTDLGLQR